MEPSQVLDKVLEERKPLKGITRGTAVEGVVGLGAAVLSIIGLAGIYTEKLLPVSIVVLGAAMVIEARVVIGRFYYVMRELGETHGSRIAGGGMSTEILGGIAGVTMGLLALMGLNPVMLCSAAVVVFGASVLFSINTIAMINAVIASGASKNALLRSMAASVYAASSDVRLLVGMGTLTLGIIAVIGIHPQTLAQIGVLSVGGALFLETFALGEKLADMFQDNRG